MADEDLKDLRLIALDAEDLSILSAHLQDAVGRVGELAYLPSERRFAALLNRFDWSATRDVSGQAKTPGVRRRSALRFERVRGARLLGINLKDPRQTLSLLAIQFEATDPPSGQVTLTFSGGAAIRLDVECIEAELRDLAGAWAAKRRPTHPDEAG
jgi:hypothetical protein